MFEPVRYQLLKTYTITVNVLLPNDSGPNDQRSYWNQSIYVVYRLSVVRPQTLHNFDIFSESAEGISTLMEASTPDPLSSLVISGSFLAVGSGRG